MGNLILWRLFLFAAHPRRKVPRFGENGEVKLEREERETTSDLQTKRA